MLTALVRDYIAAELHHAPGAKMPAVDFVAGVRAYAVRQGQPVPTRRDALFAAQILGLPVGQWHHQQYVGNVTNQPPVALTTVDGRLTKN